MKIQAVFAATLLASASAHAIPITGPMGTGTLTASSAAGATSAPAGFTLNNFGTSSTVGFVSSAPITGTNGRTITFNNSTTAGAQSGLYAGSKPNVAISPYTGTSLASQSAEYAVAQPGGHSVSITFAAGATATTFSLLWGSVDTFNSLDLDFFSGSTLVSDLAVTGSEVASAVGGTFAANGMTSAFVSVTDSTPFTSVQVASTGTSFEFVPAVTTVTGVPEPGSITLLGAGLLGLGFINSRPSRG